MACLYTLEQLRLGYTTIVNKGEGHLRNEIYITEKTVNSEEED